MARRHSRTAGSMRRGRRSRRTPGSGGLDEASRRRRDRRGRSRRSGWVVAGCGIRRGEDEPPDAGQPGRLQQADGPRDVGLERPERIANGVVDAGPRRQVDDGIDPGHGRPNGCRIGQRTAQQLVRDVPRYAAWPIERSSRMRTSSPLPTSRLVRLDPMKPAPPVMRTVRVTPDRPVRRVRRVSVRASGAPSGRSGPASRDRSGPRGP